MNLLNQIKKDNNTAILLITHDLALVSENSDNIAVMYAGKIVEQAGSSEFFAHPIHPYSKALLKSVPSDKISRLATIKGQPPTLMQNISGCKFNPRCDFCTDKCLKNVPELLEISENHYSACFLNTI
jgi:oligopeptide/dipeptide ABC transporter ATP-binding protein